MLNYFSSLTNLEIFFLCVGFLGQGIFALRFIVQWIHSEKKGGGGLGPQAQRFCGPGGGSAQPKWISDTTRQHYPLVLLRFLAIVIQNVTKPATISLSGQQRWGFTDRGAEISRV